MKLSDNTIAHVVRLLQMALLTGTDISDNLRMLELVKEKGLLEIDPDHLKNFEENLQKLQDEADAKAAELSKKPGFTRSFN